MTWLRRLSRRIVIWLAIVIGIFLLISVALILFTETDSLEDAWLKVKLPWLLAAMFIAWLPGALVGFLRGLWDFSWYLVPVVFQGLLGVLIALLLIFAFVLGTLAVITWFDWLIDLLSRKVSDKKGDEVHSDTTPQKRGGV